MSFARLVDASGDAENPGRTFGCRTRILHDLFLNPIALRGSPGSSFIFTGTPLSKVQRGGYRRAEHGA